MFSKKLVRFLLFLMLLLFLASASIANYPVKPVFAGSNGQQIQFSCPLDPYGRTTMDYAVVKGNNQNQPPQYITWQGSARQGTGYTYIFTQGSWWVGNVQIYWWNARTNSWNSMQVYVPKQQNGDISYFSCPR